MYIKFNFRGNFQWFWAVDDISLQSSSTTGLAASPSMHISDLNIYPNPTTGIVNIKGAEGDQIIIYNMTGEVVYNKFNTYNTTTIDISNLSSGNYTIKTINKKETSIQKLILSK